MMVMMTNMIIIIIMVQNAIIIAIELLKKHPRQTDKGEKIITIIITIIC